MVVSAADWRSFGGHQPISHFCFDKTFYIYSIVVRFLSSKEVKIAKNPTSTMRTSNIFAASATLLSLVQAKIAGISVPSTIKSGDTFNFIIEGTGYIQSVTDVSIAVGYYPGAAPLDDGLGIFITAFDLGKVGTVPTRTSPILLFNRLTEPCSTLVANSNYDGNFNKSVTFPTTSYTGGASFTASLESLYGVQYEPVLAPFNVSITIGEETSSDYVYVGIS